MSAAFHTKNARLERLSVPCMGNHQQLFIQRDDLIHPIVSGNKWRKLKYQIAEAKSQNKNTLVTFGGAFSNHMVATACAGFSEGLATVCFVRGEELNAQSNHYLRIAERHGMQFIPTPRELYRQNKYELFLSHFGQNSGAYFIDEGGAGPLAEKGVAEWLESLDLVPDVIVHASATATTAAGILLGLQQQTQFRNTRLIAVPVLKNAEAQTEFLLSKNAPNAFQVLEGFEFGGYAKTKPELLAFNQQFIEESGILIDPVYTAKALYALKECLHSQTISASETAIFLHTGGTLGLFSEKYIDSIDKFS